MNKVLDLIVSIVFVVIVTRPIIIQLYNTVRDIFSLTEYLSTTTNVDIELFESQQLLHNTEFGLMLSSVLNIHEFASPTTLTLLDGLYSSDVILQLNHEIALKNILNEEDFYLNTIELGSRVVFNMFKIWNLGMLHWYSSFI